MFSLKQLHCSLFLLRVDVQRSCLEEEGGSVNAVRGSARKGSLSVPSLEIKGRSFGPGGITVLPGAIVADSDTQEKRPRLVSHTNCEPWRGTHRPHQQVCCSVTFSAEISGMSPQKTLVFIKKIFSEKIFSGSKNRKKCLNFILKTVALVCCLYVHFAATVSESSVR